MAGRSFTRHSNGIGNRIRAEHINELQSALEEDDARIDLKTDDGQFTAHVDNTDNPHNVTKAQLGLGNVDNTSDADKPISTAQQAALDGKADVEDAVPDGGVYGQVLTVTHAGKQWVDPPGIVYPSLLLSPDGSFDRNGAVSPAVGGDVQVVPGQYGQAWAWTGVGGGAVSAEVPNASYVRPDRGTVLARVRFLEESGYHRYVADINQPSGLYLGRYNSGRAAIMAGGQFMSTGNVPLGAWVVLAIAYDGAALTVYLDGMAIGRMAPTPQINLGSAPVRARMQELVQHEGMLTYPVRIPDAELARISAMPTAWTMQNTAVNMALASQPPATPSGASLLNYFPPNRKVAAGGATLRTAPGTTAPTITTLAAGTDVHSTGATQTVSSVSYTLLMTSMGQGWVPTTALI